MVTGFARLGGATARRAAAAALSRSGFSPLTRFTTSTMVVNPPTAPSMASRLRFSPFLPGSPCPFCHHRPPAGSTPTEAEIFKTIKEMEEIGNTRARVMHAHNQKISQDIYEVSKALGIAGSAARESVRDTATMTVAVLGLFITSALLLVYGIIGRSEVRGSKASASSKAATAAAEKARAAADKATAAADKAKVAADKAMAAAARTEEAREAAKSST